MKLLCSSEITDMETMRNLKEHLINLTQSKSVSAWKLKI